MSNENIKLNFDEIVIIGSLLKSEINRLDQSLKEIPADQNYDRRMKWKEKYSNMLIKKEAYIP